MSTLAQRIQTATGLPARKPLYLLGVTAGCKLIRAAD